MCEQLHPLAEKEPKPVASSSLYEDRIDLELEELHDVNLEWLPVEMQDEMVSGGRYVLTIRWNDQETTIWASPAQMRAIREAVDAEMEDDPPRAEFLHWIDYHWPRVAEIVAMEPLDEREECWQDRRWQEILDGWDRLCHPEDSTDILPVEHCRRLGIAEGSTDADAMKFIDAKLDQGHETESEEVSLSPEETQRESLGKLERLKTIPVGAEFDYHGLHRDHKWPAKKILHHRGLQFRGEYGKTIITVR